MFGQFLKKKHFHSGRFHYSLFVVLYETNLCTGDVPSYIHYGNTASVHAIEPKAGYLAQKGSRGLEDT